jgi:hypothetical protein
VSETVLYRCLQFNRAYPDAPKVAHGQLFTWSHYRQLMTIKDGQRRRLIERDAFKNAWTAGELALRIKENETHDKLARVVALAQSIDSQKLLAPLRRALHLPAG